MILDACCGSKMFWFNKSHPEVVYMDNRHLNTTLCDGRTLVIKPDIVGDFREMPFADDTFSMVVFDPPHLIKAGKRSWLALKYGVLGNDWKDDLRRGFAECFRVLKTGGVLIFKWNETQVSLREILPLAGAVPLFGDQRSKTHWVVFMKTEALP